MKLMQSFAYHYRVSSALSKLGEAKIRSRMHKPITSRPRPVVLAASGKRITVWI